MYKKTICKYGIFSHEKNGKESVLSDFLTDIQYGKPDSIHKTKTRLVVFFSGKYSELYILPVHCEKYLKEGCKND